MKHKFILAVLILQVLIIGFLAVKIYNNRKNLLGGIRVDPINRRTIISSPSGELKHFYEPQPNSTSKDEEWQKLYSGSYAINSDNLRESINFTENKPKGTLRIITLGDSFTFGEHVALENIWPKRLEESLNNLGCSKNNKFEVINLGVRGYDIQYSVERFKLRGQKYDPDLVLWFLKDDDFTIINEVMLKNMLAYEKRMRESGEYDRATREGNFIPVWSILLKEMQQEFANLGEKKVMYLLEKNLAELRQHYQGKLILFTLPTTDAKWRNFMAGYSKSDSNTFYFGGIRNINNLEGIFVPEDGHPNDKGHAIIAEDMAKYLLSDNLISCN